MQSFNVPLHRLGEALRQRGQGWGAEPPDGRGSWPSARRYQDGHAYPLGRSCSELPLAKRHFRPHDSVPRSP
jgi:hypothetical protein